jgi:GNAT superfamily N-acetyltransferase
LIRPIQKVDFDPWLELWKAYLAFYRASVSEEVTAHTFDRLVGQRDGLLGLVAADDASDLLGFAHLIFHPSTWATGPYCYLEDLFVAPRARGGSTARALIMATYEEAERRGAARTYWHTQQYNGPARSLYDEVGSPTSFVVYQRPPWKR